MVIGPMDYTPGSVRPVYKEDYEPSYQQPLVLGTQMHQVAKLVVFESPVLTLNEGPAAYSKSSAFNIMKHIPASWDETKVLKGKIGEYIIIARRNSDKWYIGAMTDWSNRNLTVPLNFLGAGEYNASIYTDVVGSTREPSKFESTQRIVANDEEINLYLAPGGGAVIILAPED